MTMTAPLEFRPDWSAKPDLFRHSWKGLVNIDQFRWLVRRDTQEHLQLAYDELGARHVRVVGMLDEELRVLGADPGARGGAANKGVRMNWRILDYCIDALIDIGLDPMLTTTFMPPQLASGDRTVFSTRANVSMPKDMGQWSDLIAATLQHFIQRYGRARVRNWYCEVWNEPNLDSFFCGTQADFFHLWQETFRAIKSVDTELRVGGPSTARAEWIDWLITEGRANGCEPDYIVGHIYNNDSEQKPLSPFNGPQEDQQSGSPHFADAVIRGTRELLDSMNFTGELQWNEWGRSWLPSDPIRESANEAAFVVKSMAN